MRKYLILSSLATFIVVFNLGYIFHDLLMGQWFHEKIGSISKDEYIIPLIAVSFVVYSIIQAFLFPIFQQYASTHYNWKPVKTGLVFGGLMGFFWDGLQGGLIEVATFHMPVEVFIVDSSYHTLEGCLAGFIISLVYKRRFKGRV